MLIYRVHVAVIDIEPPIWRRIELSSRTTLKQFHRILQIAMGWENYHLQLPSGLTCLRWWRTYSVSYLSLST